MSEQNNEIKSAGESSVSQTIAPDKSDVIESVSGFKTIGTQCGGDNYDEENIMVGKLSYSPQRETEFPELIDDQKTEDFVDEENRKAVGDIFNQVSKKNLLFSFMYQKYNKYVMNTIIKLTS